MALILLAAIAALRPPSPREGPSRNAYWSLKKSTRGRWAAVIAGDSRVLHGVAPSEMAGRLQGEIFNFGFSACGYSDDYLHGVGQALRPGRDGDRVILLGITPHSLTRNAAANNGFESAEAGPAWEAALRWKARPFLERLDPLGSSLARRVLGDGPGAAPERERFEFHADGWVSLEWVPPWPDYYLPRIPLTFAGNRVDPGRVNAVMAAVRAWRSTGIAVFGFRPPTPKETAAKEDEASSFEEGAFVVRFREAGGKWLAIEGDYPTFDGHHLGDASARRFSRSLAGAVELGLSR